MLSFPFNKLSKGKFDISKTRNILNEDHYEGNTTVSVYDKYHNGIGDSCLIKYYTKNPNFLKSEIIRSLNFKAHPHFKINDISERLELLQRICERIWSTEYFTDKLKQ